MRIRCPDGTPERVRFWAHVETPVDGCWEWTGGTTHFGYGAFKKQNRVQVNSHRYSWELHNGPIPEGVFVCHRCDNPLCVRPDHLFLGSGFDNMRDASKKGRMHNQFSKMTNCIHGHPLSGDNLKIRSDGSRACRTCLKRRGDERRARQRAKLQAYVFGATETQPLKLEKA